MNFKFLFNDNLADNRLMQSFQDDEELYGYGSKFPGLSPEVVTQATQTQPLTEASQTPQDQSIVTSNAQNSKQTSGSTNQDYIWKTSNGINLSDLGWKYDINKSAAYNRKALKELFEAQDLGDKADSTGIIAEYLQSLDPKKVKDSDLRWLKRRRSQYGYTTDEKGNRDYYKKTKPWVSALATIGGGLFFGPIGAIIGNLLTRPKSPSGAKPEFYSPALDSTDDTPTFSTNIFDYGLQGVTKTGDNMYKAGDNTYQFDQSGLNYYGKSPYGENSPLQSYGTVDNQGQHTFKGYGIIGEDGVFKPVTKATIDNTIYNYNNGKWININSAGVQSELKFNDQDKHWYHNGVMVEDPNKITFSRKGGKMYKFQQGGQIDQEEQMILAATLGMVGYAKSQGQDLDIESAVTQVLSIAQSDPTKLQNLVKNTKFIQAGAQVLEQKNPELFKQIQQPGAMKKLVSQIASKYKTKKAMNGTKLNYIKELKGICPEGYEIEYFAAGGHICSRCAAKKKIEEAKCGKKMKAKKHEGGGVSTTVNKVKEDMQKNKKDSTNTKQTQSKTTFDDGRDKLLLKTSPRTYDQAKHQKLINEFKKNGYSYKGWSKAKADSLTRYNALLGSDEDSDWSF